MQDYTPRTLKFDRPGIEWVWENIHTLRSGIWPGSKPSSGYTELPGSAQRGIAHASFETCALTAAEVEIRAKRCGLDGYLVEEKYVKGMSEEEIAKARHLPVTDVYWRINKVLWYSASGRVVRWISTKKREGLTYEQWKKLRSYRRSI